MRIAYFTEALPPIVDGVTRTLSHLAHHLQVRQVTHRFYTGVATDGEWHDRVHQIPSVPFLPYDYYRMAIPFQRRLEQDLDRFAPTMIHVVNPTLLGNWAIGYADRCGLPVVSSFHTDFVSYFKYYGLAAFQQWGWRYLSWFYNRCDVTYVPSSAATRQLAEHGIHNTELWERGIDRGQFGPEHRDPELRARLSPDGETVLLFVGRLVREKDLADLVAATRILEERHARLTVAIVGAGPMEHQLRDLLPRGHFAGHQSGRDLARWYASADILAFPSTTETFGNVVLEGFASGLPAVVVAAGGVQDLVRPSHNGLICPPHDARAFADALEAIIRNPSYHRRLREGALQTADRRDWAHVNDSLLASYERLARRVRKAA
jgi:glycosyltransferase involved in cell wall biosynthesis